MNAKGMIYAIGIGNSPSHITDEVKTILKQINVVGGHPGFVDMCRKYLSSNTKVINDAFIRSLSSDFVEAQQNRVAGIVNQALQGKKVAVLSGGDTGIWGEAAFFIEAQKHHLNAFDVRVIPGIPGFVSCAARVGAPLMNGFALISIGDEDVPFDIVKKRLKGAAEGQFTIVLYKVLIESANSPEYYPVEKYPHLYPPDEVNKKRLQETYDLLSSHIPQNTPMAIVTDVYSQTSNYQKKIHLLGSDDGGEKIVITEFGNFLDYSCEYRFFTTIIIGESITQRWENYLYTPQWVYNWQYSPNFLRRIQDVDYLI